MIQQQKSNGIYNVQQLEIYLPMYMYMHVRPLCQPPAMYTAHVVHTLA
jgi:hypothetical protein